MIMNSDEFVYQSYSFKFHTTENRGNLKIISKFTVQEITKVLQTNWWCKKMDLLVRLSDTTRCVLKNIGKPSNETKKCWNVKTIFTIYNVFQNQNLWFASEGYLVLMITDDWCFIFYLNMGDLIFKPVSVGTNSDFGTNSNTE